MKNFIIIFASILLVGCSGLPDVSHLSPTERLKAYDRQEAKIKNDMSKNDVEMNALTLGYQSTTSLALNRAFAQSFRANSNEKLRQIRAKRRTLLAEMR